MKYFSRFFTLALLSSVSLGNAMQDDRLSNQKIQRKIQTRQHKIENKVDFDDEAQKLLDEILVLRALTEYPGWYKDNYEQFLRKKDERKNRVQNNNNQNNNNNRQIIIQKMPDDLNNNNNIKIEEEKKEVKLPVPPQLSLGIYFNDVFDDIYEIEIDENNKITWDVINTGGFGNKLSGIKFGMDENPDFTSPQGKTLLSVKEIDNLINTLDERIFKKGEEKKQKKFIKVMKQIQEHIKDTKEPFEDAFFLLLALDDARVKEPIAFLYKTPVKKEEKIEQNNNNQKIDANEKDDIEEQKNIGWKSIPMQWKNDIKDNFSAKKSILTPIQNEALKVKTDNSLNWRYQVESDPILINKKAKYKISYQIQMKEKDRTAIGLDLGLLQGDRKAIYFSGMFSKGHYNPQTEEYIGQYEITDQKDIEKLQKQSKFSVVIYNGKQSTNLTPEFTIKKLIVEEQENN